MDSSIKVQCPHCEAVYKYSAKLNNAKEASARCTRCQQTFMVKENLVGSKPVISNATRSKKLKAVTPNNQDTNSAVNPIIIEDTVEDTSVPSSTSTITYDNSNENEWLETLFDDDVDNSKKNHHQRRSYDVNSQASTDSHHSKSSNTSYSNISHSNKEQQIISEDLEIFPSDFIETLYKEVKKNQLILSKKQQAQDTSSELEPQDINVNDTKTADKSETDPADHHQQEGIDADNKIGPVTPLESDTTSSDNSENISQLPIDDDQNTVLSTDAMSDESNTAPFLQQQSTTQKISQWFENLSNSMGGYSLASNSATQKPVYISFFWAFGCFVLLLLLLAQYVIFNLDNLIKNPSSQGKLAIFCKVASCSIPSADLHNIIVTNQTIRPSTVTAGRTDILASLVNTSNEEQLYPNLHVRLYHDQKLLGEFIATPDDYLTVSQRILSRKQFRLFLLSTDIAYDEITKVEIMPFY